MTLKMTEFWILISTKEGKKGGREGGRNSRVDAVVIPFFANKEIEAR